MFSSYHQNILNSGAPLAIRVLRCLLQYRSNVAGFPLQISCLWFALKLVSFFCGRYGTALATKVFSLAYLQLCIN